MRVVTYNIHKAVGLDGRKNVRRIAAVLREIDADAIALQEILEPQARQISEILQISHVFGANRLHENMPYGNATFSKLNIIESENSDISVGTYEKRGCLRVRLQMENLSLLDFCNVHLGTSFFERRKQIFRLYEQGILRSALEKNAPCILLGDFNEWMRGVTTAKLNEHFQCADVRQNWRWRKSYPGIFPFLHLDHIYYDNDLKLENSFLHRSPNALIASDHLPLIADFSSSAK